MAGERGARTMTQMDHEVGRSCAALEIAPLKNDSRVVTRTTRLRIRIVRFAVTLQIVTPGLTWRPLYDWLVVALSTVCGSA